MMRFFIIFIFSVMFLDASSDVDSKIKKANQRIKSFSKNYTSLNKKMALNAKAILKRKHLILKQQKYLTELKKELEFKSKSYEANIAQLKEMKKTQSKLKEVQNSIEEELVFVIAKSVSLSMILEEDYAVDEESLIEFEVLQKMLSLQKQKAKRLNKTFYRNSKDIKILNAQASYLESAIKNIERKRKKLILTQKENKKSLEKLKIAKAEYKKSLKKLLRKQDALKKTLANLNIIKIDEIRKAKEDAQRKKAFSSKVYVSNKDLPKVKKHGSSYQRVRTKRYLGRKTIAPFNPYTITKKYGTYTDPIYGIKVFNESISLKPKSKNQKVKTVFNGKVIYADKTAVLNNIVIVEHKDGLHTIYANLSQISPKIKKGKKIAKGYTIGRVNDELIFEVTQKSYHINPIRLFQ